MHEFPSKARSSEVAPRYDLIEPAFVRVTAGRMAQGAETHGAKNYMNGADDPEFIRDRTNHLVGHVLAFAAGDASDDHFAAVCANCNMLAALLKR